jgi:hypothetical protein
MEALSHEIFDHVIFPEPEYFWKILINDKKFALNNQNIFSPKNRMVSLVCELKIPQEKNAGKFVEIVSGLFHVTDYLVERQKVKIQFWNFLEKVHRHKKRLNFRINYKR